MVPPTVLIIARAPGEGILLAPATLLYVLSTVIEAFEPGSVEKHCSKSGVQSSLAGKTWTREDKDGKWVESGHSC